jgi:hypothetical protein
MGGGKPVAGNAENGGGRRRRFWRIAPWVLAALILRLPMVAMQLTPDVVWDATVSLSSAMLFGACGACELAARSTGNIAY